MTNKDEQAVVGEPPKQVGEQKPKKPRKPRSSSKSNKDPSTSQPSQADSTAMPDMLPQLPSYPFPTADGATTAGQVHPPPQMPNAYQMPLSEFGQAYQASMINSHELGTTIFQAPPPPQPTTWPMSAHPSEY